MRSEMQPHTNRTQVTRFRHSLWKSQGRMFWLRTCPLQIVEHRRRASTPWTDFLSAVVPKAVACWCSVRVAVWIQNIFIYDRDRYEYVYTGWSKMYLPSLNSVFSATNYCNLKLCWHTVILKPFVYHLFSFGFVQYWAADIRYRRVHSIIWKPRKGQKNVAGKFDVKFGSDRHTISNLVKKFRNTGSVLDDHSQSGRPSTARTEINIQNVRGQTHWIHRIINGFRCWFEWDFYASSFRWNKALNLVGTFWTTLYVCMYV
jgi:hypothetical protein